MDISRCSTQLLEGFTSLQQLPEEVLGSLHHGSNTQYLDTLSQLALDPNYTTKVFTTHEQIFAGLCGRWLQSPEINDLSALAALAKILPSAPYLSVYAQHLLKRKHGVLKCLASREITTLRQLSLMNLTALLLAICRLLVFDNEAFASAISPAQLQVLLNHVQPHIRYLSIKILCLYLHASDAALMSMIKSYIGKDEILGQWEDKMIDYSFFSLWERKRLTDLDRMSHQQKGARSSDSLEESSIPKRVLAYEELSANTACIAGVLIPNLHGKDLELSSLIMTETTRKNIHMFANAVNSLRPILMTGCSGAGKTSIIRHVANVLGKNSSMVSLHLNGQTDAKLLIGMYASAKTPGSFSWSPGVLTKAVMEGRWLVIEDLDQAPTEIVSTLLPLLERRELFVSNWGKSIKAAPGFKLIATVRSAVNSRGEGVLPITSMLGRRHWMHVPFGIVSDEEFSEIAIEKFPLLHAYIPRFMDVYQRLRDPTSLKAFKPTKYVSVPRPLGLQDLLRWCGRVQDLLVSAGIISGHEPISDTMIDHIFLEAVDCFVGSYTPQNQRAGRIDHIAQGLHMPAERVKYCFEARKPEYVSSSSAVRIGRTTLLKRKQGASHKSSGNRLGSSPFATTNQVIQTLESIAVAVKQAEPCLLVGETGTGKTTLVQHLADALNRKLTVVNLSQQSEVGDLLGGYKPVNMRALAVPMKEEFEDLLESTGSSKQNQRYVEVLGKSISKRQWIRALALWQEALRMIERRFQPAVQCEDGSKLEPVNKKRKLQSSKLQKLRGRWDKFASDVQIFEKHLASGSKGFAFSFIEGNIIKAARNGEWVLLDEINLASPDTLESLADLFSHANDSGPSVLLTESGDTERIYAHKDFRVFGAMNPATDIGKRELPMGLRSRFTELYIDAPDRDLNDLVPLVKAYLGSHCNVDVRAATDIARLYLEIKKLANTNRLVDGAKQKPHFSLRTLTRTLIYVLDIAPLYGLRRALFEGFSMSFLTSLDTESEKLLQPLIDKYILAGQKNSRALLHQTPHEPQDGKGYIRFKHYWILRGAGPSEKQAHYIITPFIERNLLNLVRATSTRRFPVLLQGPTSSGKTSMIEYLARISGNIFVRINNHEHTDLQEYLGSYVSGPDGRLEYQEGVLVQALRQGYWVVLDELNLAPTDVLEALNRLLDDNRELLIPETQQVVRPHQNFMLFATQNPAGMYGGRKALSRAFRNRFLELHFDDIPENELETILRERSQIAPPFCNKIVRVYQELTKLRQSERLFEQKNSFATLRDLFRWASRDADLQERLATNGFLLLGERVRDQGERSVVKTAIEDVMKVKIDDGNLYQPSRTDNLPSRFSSSQAIVWTKSMRRLYVLVTEALKNNEPVLLIGETGSGKTTICQLIAETTKTKLHIVNAHQNMETSDLIGAQRPIRDKAQAESQLAQELKAVLQECNAYDEGHQPDLPMLLEMYEELQRQAPVGLSNEMRVRVDRGRIRVNSLFEWVDGSLVNAMRNGHHFLLDEISLADDSVLERLNSVLESNRTLFLAEKGIADDPVEAAPGFQFLATMNPGGDYGKRELSPALRNRFTEIWVPNASSEEEMLEIAQAKLGPQSSRFSKPMVAFAAWYSASYGGATPHISIRDLLSWIEFVNVFQTSDPGIGLLHGAAMVYIDGLGANPASRLSVSEGDTAVERRACLAELDKIFGVNLSAIYDQVYRPCLEDGMFSIGPFRLAKVFGSGIDSNYSLTAPTTMANVMKITRALQLSKPILLEGSPGVGKTTLVTALAQAVGMPLTRINLSDQTDLMDLFGSDVPVEGAEAGNFTWRDAPFLRAMQRGEWVLLDEMNLASQSVLEGLNACFDHRGQVYVSELDQTFEKHLNFAVFAAQNPHHQGGGRKGLPASFVNRFTTVYADNFTAEDLTMISSDIFPDVSSDIREKILHSVTALGHAFHENFRLGACGGPWEINLRDVLRWLHLVTSNSGMLSYAYPAHFQHLLFLQRFRTLEDVAIVSDVLQRYLPHEQSRTYFHSQCKDLLEIGFGILPRDVKRQPSSIQGSQLPYPNLEIAESVMLCIQSRWPCLLVGDSGSGKSDTILQLASAVGADVVEISLNSEMDTLDLVGGYEQVDPQRAVMALVKKLHDIVSSDLIENIATANEPSSQLAMLETRLRNPVLDLSELHDIIRLVTEKDEGSEYRELQVNCQDLIALAANDNGARFQWVDGILVKAVKQGKWVILDNANLCSPSVLDRLNSLLEPSGYLSINEHRSIDGGAEVVVPHKDFRLFMTMNPRHGELSRAMRNRSVELFMPARVESPLSAVHNSTPEFSVSRFGLFQAFDWSQLKDPGISKALSICFDHLTFADLEICHRWEKQILNGLNGLSTSNQPSFCMVAKAFSMASGSAESVFHTIRDTYEQLGTELAVSSSDFVVMQPLHPFNNPILLSATDKNIPSRNLRWLGDCLDLVLDIYGYLQKIATLDHNVASQDQPLQTRLERSMEFLRSGRFRQDTTQPLASFLQDMGTFLRRSAESEALALSDNRQDGLLFLRQVLNYLQDVFDLGQSPQFDEGIFQVYQTIGRSLCIPSSELIGEVSRELSTTLDTFDASWELSSGLGMERLWTLFKPATAKDSRQLESSLWVKELVDRFDALKWSSGASPQELESLQTSIVNIHDAIGTSSLPDYGSLDGIQNALDEFESRSGAFSIKTSPYMQEQLEILCQYCACQDSSTSNPSAMLKLLAGRPGAKAMQFPEISAAWKDLSQFQSMTAIGHPNAELGVIRDIIPISLLQKIEGISEVPLQSLELLCTEMSCVAHNLMISLESIQTRPLDHLLRILQALRDSVHQALNAQDQQNRLKDIRLHLLLQRFGANTQDAISTEEKIQHLHICIIESMKPRPMEAIRTSSTALEELLEAASYNVQFFTGCLLLYVPDRPFDPALRPIVDRMRHNKRKAQLGSTIQALRDVEKVFSGQTSSFRIQLAEQNLGLLGAEPEVPPIVRPQVSELGQLQAEFNNVLSTIVLRSPGETTLGSIYEGQASQIQEIEGLRANIAQAVMRLSTRFHAYDDVTRPLIAMLQGLDVGLALAILAGTRAGANDNAIRYMCEVTPFLGGGPHCLSKVTLSDLERRSTDQVDQRLHFLGSIAAARSIDHSLDAGAFDIMFQVFHSLYEEWKQRLGRDQQQNATNSSLYRYRGTEEDSSEAEDRDFKHLFPDFARLPEDGTEQVKNGNKNPREQARRLAQVQREIFQSTRRASEQHLCLLGNAAENISKSWPSQGGTSISPVPAATLLPALVMCLGETNARLQDGAIQESPYNFYTDANLTEARKLITLVRNIHIKFGGLQEVWPEHATLGEVLKTCSELLSLRHAEPVARLLTKAEQLYGYVHEWQVVASKQYTAVTLYDQLTELLVNWRRLELSTWARLLDMEDQKCFDDADAWWFVAYEVIIAAPLSMIHAGEDVRLHTEHLFGTLAEFITTSSIGQYAHNLSMINCFKRHLKVLTKTVPSMGLVHNAITNFLSYYTRFQSSVRDALRKGRQSLEKDMKEILLLASWKDTNIYALRDSAKRSHHKLFKVVRKYRILLAQTSEAILAQGIPQNTDLTSSLMLSVIPADQVDSRALYICHQHLPSWQNQPERFTNPNGTANRMLGMVSSYFVALDPAAYLDSFGEKLAGNIKALQQETPSKATQENVVIVKHLKARKRKLLADTLKSLRHMGFRSNMGADALSNQATAASILTNSPALCDLRHQSDSDAADHHFHKLVNLMPQAKESARSHSEDLTHGEVSRSFGYLENMVSVILKQRTLLASTITNLVALKETTKTMKSLWDPESHTLEHQDHSMSKSARKLRYLLSWLPSILETANAIIEKHSKLEGKDSSAVIEGLDHWKDRIVASVEAIEGLSEVSIHALNLTSTRYERMLEEAKTSIQGLRADLQDLMISRPSLRYVLRQIDLWTEFDSGTDYTYLNGSESSTLDAFDDAMSEAKDSVLVALQVMQECIANLPTSEDVAWLTRTDFVHGGSLRNLQVAELNRKLGQVTSMVGQLNYVRQGNLQAAGAICAMALPIVQQYHNICDSALDKYLQFHRSLCKVSSMLAHSFITITRDGFCSPTENTAAKSAETDKLEGGTGLGEGEGAEDISNDVQDDEDLSELAQKQDKDQEREDIEDHEDAVDMDHDEMEGEMGEGSDIEDDNDSENDRDDNDIDEEIGSVDELDPSAVDEKLWDGKAEDTDKEKQGPKSKVENEKDEQIAADAAIHHVEDGEKEGEEEDEAGNEAAEENEDVAKDETEKVDPRAQEQQGLDLPEEIDLDTKDGSDGESDMDNMSDVEQEKAEEDLDNQQDGEALDDDFEKSTDAQAAQSDDHEETEREPSVTETAGSPVDTEPTDDDRDDENHQGLLHDRSDDAAVDPDKVAPSDVQGLSGDMDQEQDAEQASTSQAQPSKGTKGSASDHNNPNTAAEDGELGPSEDRSKGAQTRDSKQDSSHASQAFKKLGDALEKWHRQSSQIREAAEQEATVQADTADVDMADQEFQHLLDEEAQGDTQALGAASDEQARALDEEAMDAEMHSEIRDFPDNQADEEGAADRDELMDDASDVIMEGASGQTEQQRPSTFVNNLDRSRERDPSNPTGPQSAEDIEDLDIDLSVTHLQSTEEDFTVLRSAEEARRLWAHYENLTRDLSLLLTEQLRLILAPTLATKMRGDFRTGKRLNIKRIIPYIASQYKRDKIWMRRSIPSKRNYQIMLAMDDSKSMGESGSGKLAFETLALVAKSLSMLEVGEICVVGFGNEVRVAHAFDKSFSSEAGAQIFQHFGFRQTKTNVRKLVADSIDLFREARRKTFNADTDLWQLELIVSDGICEDHDMIRQLVRQAQEERIMIIFVIVDALLKGESIMDMKQAIFSEGGDLQMKRYLDGFPFQYYLVVGDITELPGVLAQALRQWFSEVVDSS